MPSKSRVRRSWRYPFPFWAREGPFLCKGALDKKVQWTACQKRRGFRSDRRLLVFNQITHREEARRLFILPHASPALGSDTASFYMKENTDRPDLAWKTSLSTVLAPPRSTQRNHQWKTMNNQSMAFNYMLPSISLENNTFAFFCRIYYSDLFN